VTKKFRPGRPLVLPDTYLKWYQLSRENQIIDPADDTAARTVLTEDIAAGRLPIPVTSASSSTTSAASTSTCCWCAPGATTTRCGRRTYVKDSRQNHPFTDAADNPPRRHLRWSSRSSTPEHQEWSDTCAQPRHSGQRATRIQVTGTI